MPKRKSRYSEEKKLEKQLNKMRKEVVIQNKENTDIGDESISLKKRIAIFKSSNKKKADTDEVKIDFNKKEDEVYLETPLPVTMATEYLPIEWIHDGIIKTEFNTYIKILEIMPTNFLLKSDDEQADIIFQFQKYLKAGPSNIQFKSIAKKADLSRYIVKIEEEIQREKNEKCRQLQKDYEQLLLNLGSQEAIARRFFLIFKYQRPNMQNIDEADVKEQLDVMTERAISYLKQCGNNILIWDNPTEETSKVLYDILNRTKNSSSNFKERVQDVFAYYNSNYGEKSTQMIPIKEYVGSCEIDFTHSNYMRIDDTYYDFIFLKSSGYPIETYGGWTSKLINAGEGFDVDIIAVKQPRKKMIDKIGQRLRLSASRMRNLSSTTAESNELENAIDSGFYMKNQMVNGSQDLYYIVTMVTISAGDPKTLGHKKTEMVNYLKTNEIYTFSCNMMHELAFKSYLPFVEVDRVFYDRAKRNIMTHGLAGCYPYTSFEMSDDDGTMLGVNELNDSLVIADFFNSSIFKNANISILGTSGAGKTFLLQLLGMRFRRKQIQTFIIAPDKGHEFARACSSIGGEFITLSPTSNQCINVLEIRRKDMTASKMLEEELTTQSELAAKIQSLHIFFELLIPDINDEEDQLLDEALIVAYRKKGITHDNESLCVVDGSGKYKEMPILEDVYNELNGNPASQRIANIMNRLVHGSASSFNQQTNVDLDNLYTVIDISKLTGKLLPVGMYIALDYVYSKAKENRTKKKAIIIDEVWELIGSKSNTKAAEYVLEIFKIIRGYGGSAICGTQDLNDFFALEDGKYGKGIINNSKTKIILNLEHDEARRVQALLHLSESEYNNIVHFERGHGLLSANNSNVPIEFKASRLENDLITTDRKQLEALVGQIV